MRRRASFPSHPVFRILWLSVVAAFGVALASPAAAQFTMSASAGVFQPWSGDEGGDFRGALGGTFGQDKRYRLSGEFSYREFETEIFGVQDIEIESYSLALVFHYRLMPNAVVQPYLGARYSVSVNVLDDQAIERARSTPFSRVNVDEIGSSIGLAAIVGLEVPVGEHVFFFGEANLGAEVQLVEDNDDLDVEEIGGVSGVGGIRFVF